MTKKPGSEKKNKRYSGKAGRKDKLEGSFILPESDWPKDDSGGFVARVVEVQKRYAFVSPEPAPQQIATDDVWLGNVSRKYLQADRKERNLVVVGDRVYCVPGSTFIGKASEDLPQCSIEHRAPRQNSLARLDPMTQERKHVLASNLDQILVVASVVDPKVKWGLIDRYLVLCESEGVDVQIVLTKWDCIEEKLDEAEKESLDEHISIYEKAGYRVHKVRANQPADSEDPPLVELRQQFRDKITLVSGHSGVGKSSLVNGMEPEIVQDVEDEEIFYKGRHTTTYASLIHLGQGGYVVDTPGIRSFCIEEMDAIRLSWCFREFRPFLGKCQFRECNHRSEPDCAIKDAVSEGLISEWRYRSYLGILLGATGREGRMRDISLE